LVAKRDELIRYRDRLHAEAKKVTVDIDHLESSIRIFEAAEESPFPAYRVQHKARKGTVKRFVLATLRDASTPLSAAEITEAWLADRGLEATDDTRVLIRKRIGASLISLRAQGVLRNEGKVDGFKGWVVA
jgi:hypothetical protein